jgi:hypothetical protein
MLGMADHFSLFLVAAHIQDVTTKSPDTKTNPIFRHVGVKGVGSGLLVKYIAPAGLPCLINRAYLHPVTHALSNRKRVNGASFVKYFSTPHNWLVSHLFQRSML